MQLKKGLFITCEGGEGAGKTTLIKALERALRAKGLEVAKTREPGGTALGERVRELLLKSDSLLKIGSMAELLLFLSARAQNIEEFIKPALDRGAVVLCDRFNDSTIAYQGWARGLGISKVEQLCSLVCAATVPDISFFLDVVPEIGLKRTQKAHREFSQVDRMESEKLDFHRRVREGFHKIVEKSNGRLKVINAAAPFSAVFATSWEAVEKKLDSLN